MNRTASAMHLHRRTSPFRHFVLLFLLIVQAVTARAQTTTTNCTSFSDLVDLIGISDHIVFNCSGTISFENPITIAGDTILDGGDRNVTLSGNDVTRLFTVQNGASLTLRNLTITKGRSGSGGAIVNRGRVVVVDCSFTSNQAKGANGANGQDGAPDTGAADDGKAGGHGAGSFGGAIYNLSEMRAVRCTFSGNSATGGDGGNGGKGGDGGFASGDGGDGGNGGPGQGGAIFNNYVTILIDCSFENNTAKGGKAGTGGAGGTTALAGDPGSGGAGAVGSGAGVHSSYFLNAENCTFASNTGTGGDSAAATLDDNGLGKDGPAGAESWGGGIANLGTTYAVNCTFSTNKVTGGKGGNGGAGSSGAGDGGDGGTAYGGNFFNTGTAAITNCTFSGGAVVGGTNGVAGTGSSTAEDGEPGRSLGGNIANINAGVLRIKNNIFARATSGGNGYGAVRDLGHNMSSDASIALNGPGARINTNPRLRGLADNGGPTKTFALREDSPAIDSADEFDFPERDQRGRLRADPDRGAYEFAIGDIFGSVITADGAGVPDVAITIAGITNFTDADGFFSFERLPSDTYTVTPVSTNFVFDPPSIEVDLAAEETIEFIATPVYLISGRITQGTNGLANVNVKATGGDKTQSGTTSPDGTFSIGPLPAGDYTLEPAAAGLTFTPPIRAVTLDDDVFEANFTAGGLLSISGRITDGTNAISGVTVNIGGQTGITDGDGNYSVSGLGPYTYEVVPRDPDHAFVPTSRTVTLQTHAVGVNFTGFRAYSISGLVTNLNTGAALGNVVLTLVNTNSTNNAVAYSTTSATNDGRYTFAAVVPGTYVLRPAAPNFSFSPRTNLVTVGPSLTNESFGGFAAYSVSGSATINGAGVSNVTVRAFIGTNLVTSTTTTNSGTYTLRELAPGTYHITARQAGIRFTPLTNTLVLATSTNNINFTGEGTLSMGGVIQKNGIGLSGVLVRAGNLPPVLTDSSGSYGFYQVPPGQYVLTPVLDLHVFEPPAQTLILSNRPAAIEVFAAHRIFNVGGQITASGLPLPGVRVSSGTNVAFTGSSGEYRFPRLQGTDHTLVPELDDHAFNPPSTNLHLTETVTNLTVNFTASSTLFTVGGRITDDGVGVAGIPVHVAGRIGTTDTNGYYLIPSVPRGTHTVQPQLLGYEFTPGFQTVNLQARNTNVNFTAIGIYSISGRILEGGSALSNVLVTIGTRSTTTDTRGNYSIADLGPRQHSVVPFLQGYAFTPSSRTVTLSGDQSGIDFSGFASFSLAGTVIKLSNSTPFTNITINLFTNGTNLTLSMSTDTNGVFAFTNLRSAQYTIAPALLGHDFAPSNRVVAIGPSSSGLTFAGFPVFSMSGSVTLDGVALTNVTLAARPIGSAQPVGSATTDATGGFTIAKVPEGDYELVPTLAGYRFSPVSHIVPLRANTNNLHFAASGIYSISGRVTTNGFPVSGASVTASNRQILSDSSGLYTIADLPPGTYNVSATFASSSGRFSFEPTSTNIILGPSRANVDFNGVQVFSISGQVTENGVGLGGVTVAGGGRTDVTKSDGTYTLSSVPQGNVTVTATLAGYQMTPPQQVITLSGTTTGVDFSARGMFFIRGRISDTVTGQGLGGVTNTAGKYFAVTDNTGAYTITNMGPGAYSVIPSFPGRGFSPPATSITVGPSTNNVNFTSFRVFKLAGKVTREGTTNPMSFVSIRAVSPFGTNVIATDFGGAYQFTALRESSNYVVTASQTGNAFEPANIELPLLADATNQNFVGFTAFSISGRITENGAGVPNVDLTLTGTNATLYALSDSSGNYTFAGLRPADYSIVATRPGYDITPRSRAITVGPSASNVDFSARAVTVLSGTISQGGNGVSAVHVVLTSTNVPPDFRRSVVTDSSGGYVFTNLAPRVYFLTPEPAGVYLSAESLPQAPNGSFILDLLDHTVADFNATGGKVTITRTATNYIVRVFGIPSRSHTLQAAPSPTASNWTNYVNVFTGTNGVRDHLEPLNTNSGALFFRTRR